MSLVKVVTVNESSIEIFSKVLIEASEWLDSIDQSMWKYSDLSISRLLENYKLDEMKLCYDNNNLIGVYVLQWYDPLFWSELIENESGILHKLAVCKEYRGNGYGTKLIRSAENLCQYQKIEWLRLNCGTFRRKLRNYYESEGFEMLDRVYIDDRDQIRYFKKLV
jgi:GNAT superfamily N-acetyltransferase